MGTAYGNRGVDRDCHCCHAIASQSAIGLAIEAATKKRDMMLGRHGKGSGPTVLSALSSRSGGVMRMLEGLPLAVQPAECEDGSHARKALRLAAKMPGEPDIRGVDTLCGLAQFAWLAKY